VQRVGRPFRERDPATEHDAIVIGSGIGGLTAAALLARHAGKRVRVLERHYMPGGFTHVFRRRQYEWDVGLHYIGDVQTRRSLTRRLFDHVTDGGLEWASMGGVYDRILFGEDAYDFAAGPDGFVDGLAERFPGERAALERYVHTIRKVARRSRLYFAEKALPAPLAAAAGPLLRWPFLRWARRTTGEVLAEITADRRLRGVLAGQFGDYGLPPGEGSFGMHAVLARHYLWGGSYPVGGSSRIAAAMAPLIEDAGGEILFNAEVAEILVEGGVAVGVRMADGAELRAPLVISDAGAHNTFERLLPAAHAERHGLLERLRALAPSAAHLCLYLGLSRTAAELDLPKSNFWIYPGYDHDANVEAFVNDPQAPLPVVYVSFPSAKDPDFERRCPGRATIELITLAPWRRFAAWAGRRVRRRGADYEELKAELAERMLVELDRRLPRVRAAIDHREVSTPLSTRHFANYDRGEIYGLAHSPQRFEARWLRPRTPVRGLWLTGQDVATCGVAGAMAAGYLTASAMLGRNLLKAAGRG
jgi:all-trans-retinol 13,14-reductase